jgi:hypothetical protein
MWPCSDHPALIVSHKQPRNSLVFEKFGNLLWIEAKDTTKVQAWESVRGCQPLDHTGADVQDLG